VKHVVALWWRLLGLGRAGGVALLALGGALLYAAWWLFGALVPEGAELWSPRGTAAAFMLAAVAVPFVVAGVKNLVAPSPVSKRADVDELLAAARVKARPFYVCTRCRELFAARECRNGRCLECGTFEGCREIASDDDLALLEAELS
jgi:hypothetical protein